MTEEIPYGFYVEKESGLMTSKYNIVDLSRDKIILKAEFYGSFKPQIYIMNLHEEVIISAKKVSFWGNKWIIERKNMILAEVYDSKSMCNSDVEIITESERIIASRMKVATYQALNSMGREMFLFEKETWTLREKFQVEVKDEFEPLIALCVSFIMNNLIKQQQSAASTAVVTASI